MKFEKEILRDYNELIKHVIIIRSRYKNWLKSSLNTATTDDYINDGILKYSTEAGEVYSIDDLKKCINSSMNLEESYLKKRNYINPDEDHPFNIKFNTKVISEPVPEYITEKKVTDFLCHSSDKYNYFINKKGEMFRQPKSGKKILKIKPKPKNDGYILYSMGDKIKYAHRLVYERHKGKIPKNKEIHHIDHDKTNNHIDNLRLVTHRQSILLYHATFCKLKKEKEIKKLGAPIGQNHGKFTGYYIINGEAFESSYLAEKATGINYRTIQRKCKNNYPGFSFLEV